MKVAVVEDDWWNSTMILGIPGANMEEPRGVMMVSTDKVATLNHFLLSGQFLGL
jgi:hypothetical protein